MARLIPVSFQVSNNTLQSLYIEQGYVFAFGSNREGQLGIGDKSIKYSTAPLLVSDLKTLKPIKISCGAEFTGVLSMDGEVFVWGSNSSGQCCENNISSSSQRIYYPKKL